MQRLILKWYQENKKSIWTVILIFILVTGAIGIFNRFYKNNNSEKNTNNGFLKNEINNEISGKLESTKSLVSDEGVSKDNLKSDTKIIDEFLKYCMSKEFDKAYRLLTDECKEVKYNSLEKFESLYCESTFDDSKSYSIQNWENRTYQVNIKEDALATGRITTNTPSIQDYITVVEKDNEKKINIGSYIGRRDYNKSKEYEGMTVEVRYKDIYMDYEIYNVKVTNNTTGTILFDDEKNINSIYLEDEKNIKENVLTGEVLYSDMKIESGHFKTYDFKFANAYSTSRKISAIVFERVTMNYSEENEKNDLIKIIINI